MKQLDILRRRMQSALLALQESGIQAHVTIDPEEAHAHLNNGGQLVLLCELDRIEYETWNIITAHSRFVLISPLQHTMEAWPSLDEASEALALPLETDSVSLTAWAPINADRTYPCVLMTSVETEIEE